MLWQFAWPLEAPGNASAMERDDLLNGDGGAVEMLADGRALAAFGSSVRGGKAHDDWATSEQRRRRAAAAAPPRDGAAMARNASGDANASGAANGTDRNARGRAARTRRGPPGTAASAAATRATRASSKFAPPDTTYCRLASMVFPGPGFTDGNFRVASRSSLAGESASPPFEIAGQRGGGGGARRPPQHRYSGGIMHSYDHELSVLQSGFLCRSAQVVQLPACQSFPWMAASSLSRSSSSSSASLDMAASSLGQSSPLSASPDMAASSCGQSSPSSARRAHRALAGRAVVTEPRVGAARDARWPRVVGGVITAASPPTSGRADEAASSSPRLCPLPPVATDGAASSEPPASPLASPPLAGAESVLASPLSLGRHVE